MSVFPKYKLNKGLIWGIIIAFVVIVIIFPILLTRTWGPDCLKFSESTGWIGDTLGGITAPFIGFVNIILLIWTLWKQVDFNKEQLRVQKNEQFKAAFFQMLQTQRELLHEVKGTFLSRNMERDVNGGKVAGLDYFHNAGSELKTLFSVLDGEVASEELLSKNIKERYCITEDVQANYNQAGNEKQLQIAYKQFFDVHIEMANYFRHLYHILKFISEEKKDSIKRLSDEKEKAEITKWYKGYADMLQATLSAEELRMAYYNCAAFNNARELFKEFQFVENLTKKNLIRPDKDMMEGFEIKEKYLYESYR